MNLLALKTQSHIKFHEFTILHTINPRLKNYRLQINEYGEIELKTPRVAKRAVLAFLEEHKSWIERKFATKTFAKRAIVAEEIELFGKIYPLHQTPFFSIIKKTPKTQDGWQRAYNRFYLELSKKILPKRVDYFSHMINLYPKELKFRKMKRRWGSCSSQGVLTFNTNLLKKEPHFIDEVVVHELVHLKHFNHSQSFHDLVRATLSQAHLLTTDEIACMLSD